jgi:CHAD domain-containing protein
LSGQAGHGPAEAVHEARKDIKKLRSLLRLLRDDLGETVYRRENDWLRETAQGLAGARDAEVLAVTLDGLVGNALPAEAVAPLRAGLQGVRRRAAGDPGPAMTVAAQRLDVVRQRLDAWPLSGDATALSAGLRRSYARGRSRGRAARRSPSVDGLHEWRKRVKDLWYQATLVRCADPAGMKPAGDQAHELSTLLGDDHDLGLLGEAAAAGGFLFATRDDQQVLLDAVRRRRDAIQAEAFALAQRLYAPKPGAFVRGVEGWAAPATAGLPPAA